MPVKWPIVIGLAFLALLYFVIFNVSAQAVVLALLLVVVTLLGSGFRVRIHGPTDAVTNRLRVVIIAAIMIRVAVAVFVSTSGLDYLLAPDTRWYETSGWAWSQYWAGELSDSVYDTYLFRATTLYHFFVGGVYMILGREPVVPGILNGVLGGLLVYVAFLVALELGMDRKKALWAVVPVAFWPSLVLWSALNLRDVWMIFSVALGTLCWLRLMAQGYTNFRLVGLLCSMTVIFFVRHYMLPIVVLGLLLSFVVWRVRDKMKATILLLVATFTVLQLDTTFGFSVLQTVAQLQNIREGFQGPNVGSVFATDVKMTDVSDVLAFLPVAMGYFLFAPFPWQAKGFLQSISAVEVSLFYMCFGFLVIGWWATSKKNYAASATVLFVVFVVAASYAIAEGNIGTIYRHKAQVLPFMLMFIVPGIIHFKESRRRGIFSVMR